ncbi:ATPase [Albimonas sp. CAU 1670]|uniref:F0F1 ATP synthase subunit B family protein n=1 Tax=Albimonas sp. CAU 1670 TaxID=3032599 RepID=UPI0023D9B34D|nr:ATPase [Albimonas sp. CAU 1670]MDF2235455.1 ATPase [Albimonas sp. CAU 1670]
MDFDWTSFAFQVVNVLILLAILRHFLFRPVAAIIAKRQAEAASVLKDAEAEQAAAKAAADAAKAEAETTRAARAAALDAAHADAEKARADLLAQAQAEAERIREAARAETARHAAETEAARAAETARLALAAARRALEAQPADRALAGYPQRLADALAEMPPTERDALLNAGNLRLAAPRPLTEAELAETRGALAPHLPHPETLPIDIDPDLLAGLDLRADTGVLRNSLSHDLTRLSRALTAPGAGEGPHV